MFDQKKRRSPGERQLPPGVRIFARGPCGPPSSEWVCLVAKQYVYTIGGRKSISNLGERDLYWPEATVGPSPFVVYEVNCTNILDNPPGETCPPGSVRITKTDNLHGPPIPPGRLVSDAKKMSLHHGFRYWGHNDHFS